MTAQRIKKLTVEEYVAFEQSTNTKYEYHDGKVFALAGGSLNHSILCMNISGELRNKILSKNKNCFTFNSEMKLNIEKFNKYFYPDSMVVCGEFAQSPQLKDAINNPVLIVEVLSEKTETYDRGEKFHQYSSIPTFQEYLLISQYKPLVEVFYRKPKTKTWEINRYEGFDMAFNLKSLSIEIKMNDLYERVVFKDDSEK